MTTRPPQPIADHVRDIHRRVERAYGFALAVQTCLSGYAQEDLKAFSGVALEAVNDIYRAKSHLDHLKAHLEGCGSAPAFDYDAWLNRPFMSEEDTP